jgi:hypothetical protein
MLALFGDASHDDPTDVCEATKSAESDPAISHLSLTACGRGRCDWRLLDERTGGIAFSFATGGGECDVCRWASGQSVSEPTGHFGPAPPSSANPFRVIFGDLRSTVDVSLSPISELLETAVLLTAFDNPVGDVHQNRFVGLLDRQEF